LENENERYGCGGRSYKDRIKQVTYFIKGKVKMSIVKTIKIDNVEYVRKDSLTTPALQLDGLDYVIIRTYSAGVHAGYLKYRLGKEVVLVNARRLWYWDGAASLSQLAVDGTASSSNCKFPCEVPEITLTEAIEIIPCSEKAQKSIQGVKIWKQ